VTILVSKLEINIAEKVREVHGPREWKKGDIFFDTGMTCIFKGDHLTNDFAVVDVVPRDGWIPEPRQFPLWLPTQMDYMDLLWGIDADRFILADDGVYEGETHYKGDTWTFNYDNRYDSPSKAWWKVINDG
jgi:hypothetical protein